MLECQTPGRPILKANGGHFPIYLSLGVYGHGVCLHSRSADKWVTRGRAAGGEQGNCLSCADAAHSSELNKKTATDRLCQQRDDTCM
jgi:hypothetical protein